ncbi:MAG: hypothetical protein ACN4E2_04100 [Nitrospinota bacterium]
MKIEKEQLLLFEPRSLPAWDDVDYLINKRESEQNDSSNGKKDKMINYTDGEFRYGSVASLYGLEVATDRNHR